MVLVMDQLNIHSLASLHEAFAPAEARRIADRPQTHHAPKHGSWPNPAESESSVLAMDLPERVGDRSAMARHVGSWTGRRTAAGASADWPFTTADARIQFRKLYPTIDE